MELNNNRIFNKLNLFNRFPKSFYFVILTFFVLIIILSLYSLLTRPDSKKDEISPRQVQTGNIINLDNKFSNFDPDRVVATFLEAMNQGNLDLSKGFISELASKNNIDKLYVGEESILNKNVSYEIVNIYYEKSGFVSRVTVRIDFNGSFSFYIFSLLKDSETQSWNIVDLEVVHKPEEPM